MLDDVTFTSSCENIHYTGDLIVGNSSSATLNQDCGTFTVDGDVILGNLATGAGTYNLGGTAVLTVGGDLVVGKSGSGVFNQSGGSVTVDGTLLIAANAGANGTYNLTGGTLNAPTVVNNGSFNFTGGTANINSITGTGATTVGNGRTLQVNHVRQSTLNVNGTVRINPNGSASGVSKLNNLNVASSGSLDLKDNDLVVDYAGTTPLGTFNGTAYTGLSGKIASAYDFGAWDGFGITTSMPDAQAGLTTLGIGEASEILTLSGTDTDLWGGQTVDATSVLIRYTYAGDVNLDGVIDGGDYGILDNYVAIPGASGYAHGDVNYDGVIDGGDYAIVDNNIQAQGAPLTTSGAMGVTGVTAVPEPASIGVLVGMAGALALRRRR